MLPVMRSFAPSCFWVLKLVMSPCFGASCSVLSAF